MGIFESAMHRRRFDTRVGRTYVSSWPRRQPEEDARHYQEELRQGRTLVIVQALGRGGEALEILRRCEPLD